MTGYALQVLEPNHRILIERLKAAEGVEQLLDLHEDFLNTSLKEGMLTSPQLLKVAGRAILEIWTRLSSHLGTLLP